MLKVFQEGISIKVTSESMDSVGEFKHLGRSHIAFSDGTAVVFDQNKCDILQKGTSFITVETDSEVLGDMLFIGRDIKWMICGEYIGRGYKIPWL